jgi:hypothetical protein
MLILSVYVYKPLPPGVYPIAVDKYIKKRKSQDIYSREHNKIKTFHYFIPDYVLHEYLCVFLVTYVYRYGFYLLDVGIKLCNTATMITGFVTRELAEPTEELLFC